jgi:hypothetical protein
MQTIKESQAKQYISIVLQDSKRNEGKLAHDNELLVRMVNIRWRLDELKICSDKEPIKGLTTRWDNDECGKELANELRRELGDEYIEANGESPTNGDMYYHSFGYMNGDLEFNGVVLICDKATEVVL